MCVPPLLCQALFLNESRVLPLTKLSTYFGRCFFMHQINDISEVMKALSDSKPQYEKAFADYLAGLKYKEIAEKYNVSLSTVKSWKTRHWKDTKSTHTKNGKVRVPKKKIGAPFGNKNATGPPGNKNARKHGLFERYLPQETLDIVSEIQDKSPLDILWEQILLAYAAIIRARQSSFCGGR